MSPRFLCLQGHLWEYEERHVPKALFCPTCGLRLYAEAQAPSIPVTSQRLGSPTPMPLSNADIWRLNRSTMEEGTPAAPIQPNDIEAIPGYELLGVLGRGGMGIVFRARQLSLKRQVALKMILTGRHARPSERARLQREAEAVQIHEVGEQNGLPYCALEFVNAGSLAQFLGHRPHSARIVARFVHVLAQAMHYAHKRGIVHRDLKPANILLHLDESRILKEGQVADTALFDDLLSYVPKISDFGLAMHMGNEDGSARQAVGTPSYMAPEQARGTSGEVGPAADVYALGAVLYEMLTGRPPFQASSAEETALQVLTQEPPPPTHYQPRIPRDLETICLVCLQKNPLHRYGSAEALAEDLRRFLANEPIRARPTHLPERVVKWAHRRPILLSCGLGGLVLTSIFWWVSWSRAVTTQAEKEKVFQAWQKSEDRLDQAMQTIDHLVEQETTSRPTLLKAKQFYEHLVEEDGPPARMGQAHYRLGRLYERLDDPLAAQDSYRAAIACFEKLAQTGQTGGDQPWQLQASRDRLAALERP
jgi:serine/threonine protein kinase